MPLVSISNDVENTVKNGIDEDAPTTSRNSDSNVIVRSSTASSRRGTDEEMRLQNDSGGYL